MVFDKCFLKVNILEKPKHVPSDHFPSNSCQSKYLTLAGVNESLWYFPSDFSLKTLVSNAKIVIVAYVYLKSRLSCGRSGES